MRMKSFMLVVFRFALTGKANLAALGSTGLTHNRWPDSVDIHAMLREPLY